MNLPEGFLIWTTSGIGIFGFFVQLTLVKVNLYSYFKVLYTNLYSRVDLGTLGTPRNKPRTYNEQNAPHNTHLIKKNPPSKKVVWTLEKREILVAEWFRLEKEGRKATSSMWYIYTYKDSPSTKARVLRGRMKKKFVCAAYIHIWCDLIKQKIIENFFFAGLSILKLSMQHFKSL